ncbi:MAG TPA: ABC transporter permease [Candidatus Sulfotelmatobacter sp.]|nr:ABC transporter permease [Candidatus Sulfotelmatobacter sp.]
MSTMLPGGLATRELALTLMRPRSLALRVGIPLVLAVPLAAGGAPTFWAGMLLTVLVAMVGAVGTAITIARARASGLLARLTCVPASRPRLVLSWVGTATSIDLAQLLPALAVVLVSGGAGPTAWISLLVAGAAALLVANSIGCLVTLVGSDAGEVLLGVTVILAPVLFLGGLFTGVPREGWRWWAARVDPFSYLHSAFISALGGAPAFAPGAILTAAALSVLVALITLALVSRPLIEKR